MISLQALFVWFASLVAQAESAHPLGVAPRALVCPPAAWMVSEDKPISNGF